MQNTLNVSNSLAGTATRVSSTTEQLVWDEKGSPLLTPWRLQASCLPTRNGKSARGSVLGVAWPVSLGPDHESAALNGIDFLEVVDRDAPAGSPRQRTLLLRFLKAAPALGPENIEITGGGKPTVNLYGTAKRRAEMLGVTEIHVTITHTDVTAMVMAVATGEH